MPSTFLTSSTFGAVAGDALIQRPMAIVGRTSGQSLSASTLTQLTFNSTVLDTGAATVGTSMVAASATHSGYTGSSGASSIYIRQTGVYQVTLRGGWDGVASAAGRRQVKVMRTRSGSNALVMEDTQTPINDNTDTVFQLATLAVLQDGDELWAVGYHTQTGGTSVSITTTSGIAVELGVAFMGLST